MPTEFLPLDKIVVNREVDTRDGFEQLEDSIARHGLKIPILVDADFNLIDGLRRLKAFERLGRPEIEAYVSWTHEESIEWLAKAHAKGARPMSARRVAQIHAALTPQLRARQAGVGERQRGIKKKDRGPIDRSKHYNSRLLLTNALRLTSDAMIQIAAKVYRLEHVDSPDGEFIRTLIPQLDAGEMTLHQAGNRYETWLKQQSLTITTESEQRQIISAATTQLRAIVNGLRPIGDINIRIKKEEAIKWLTELQLANQQIRKTVKQLTKRLG